MNCGHLRQAPAHHRDPLRKDERDDLRRRLDAEAEERRRIATLLTEQHSSAKPDIGRGWREWFFRK